jgi:hypothetical protein
MHDALMRVQVQCRRGGEPRTFLLGARWLHVMRVLERAAENSLQRFRVRVPDGREFVLRHDLNRDDWQLFGVFLPRKSERADRQRRRRGVA